MGERTTVDFDHHGQALVDDLNGTYDELRSKCPVAYSEAHGGYWVVSSHAAVSEVAGNQDVFASDNDPNGERDGYGGNVVPSNGIRFGFVESDAPYWAGVRRLLNPYFSPPAVERWRPRFVDVTNACIDRIIEKGEGDLIDDVVSPIPAVITLLLMDLPLEKWRRYGDAMHHLNTSAAGTPAGEAAAAELDAVAADLQEIIAERRAPGYEGTDIFTVLCQAEIDGRQLTPEELLGEGLLLVNGGVDTTTSLLGSALAWLQENPTEREALSADPSLLPIATEEFLRCFAPVTGMARTATRDYELQGEEIHAGDRVLMGFVGANRDPAVFTDPDQIQLDRWPNRHASFGLGIHRCIGSNFARAIIQTVIERVLARFDDMVIDLSGSTRYPDQGINQGWVSLPFTFTPGEKVGSDIVIPDVEPAAH